MGEFREMVNESEIQVVFWGLGFRSVSPNY